MLIIALELLATATSKKNKWKEGLKCYLFVDNMILYTENP